MFVGAHAAPTAAPVPPIIVVPEGKALIGDNARKVVVPKQTPLIVDIDRELRQQATKTVKGWLRQLLGVDSIKVRTMTKRDWEKWKKKWSSRDLDPIYTTDDLSDTTTLSLTEYDELVDQRPWILEETEQGNTYATTYAPEVVEYKHTYDRLKKSLPALPLAIQELHDEGDPSISIFATGGIGIYAGTNHADEVRTAAYNVCGDTVWAIGGEAQERPPRESGVTRSLPQEPRNPLQQFYDGLCSTHFDFIPLQQGEWLSMPAYRAHSVLGLMPRVSMALYDPKCFH